MKKLITNFSIAKHEAFLTETLMPLVMAQAREKGCEIQEVALASILMLSTYMQVWGESLQSLIDVLKDTAVFPDQENA